MCKYCVGWRTPYCVEDVEDPDTGVEVNIGHGNLTCMIKFREEDDNEVYGIATCFEISYCPFCGRSLED